LALRYREIKRAGIRRGEIVSYAVYLPF